MSDASGMLVKFNIPYKAQTFAVTDIDNFFFFKSKIRMAFPVLCILQSFLFLFYARF